MSTVVAETEKVCPACKESKPHTEFSKQLARKDGLQYTCKACANEHAREWSSRPEVQERKRDYVSARYHAESVFRWKYLARNAAGHAVKSGRLVRLSCEVCGAGSAEIHHDDYDQPLSVRFFCAPHHRAHHKSENDSITTNPLKENI